MTGAKIEKLTAPRKWSRTCRLMAAISTAGSLIMGLRQGGSTKLKVGNQEKFAEDQNKYLALAGFKI